MSVMEQVATVLIEVPETMGNDKQLIKEVMRRYYNVRTLNDALRPGVPSFETIRRTRQKLVRNWHS